MKKISIPIFLVFIFFSIFNVNKTMAVCPVCAVTVGVGIGFSRWLGIDDLITGLWIGGLIMSLIKWTLSWFDKKNIYFNGRKILIAIFYYSLTVLPLYFTGIIGHPLNALYFKWLDKIFFGIIIGSVVFWLGARWYEVLKEKNDGHAYFPFQKVVMPVAPLIVLSIVFYLLTK